MDEILNAKREKLKKVFEAMGKVLVAFSGGVDSSLLLKMAIRGPRKRERSRSHRTLSLYPERELTTAKSVAGALGVRHRLIESNELEIEGFSANPPNRCYHCKRELFGKLVDMAKREGMRFIVEGSTLDDEKDHRPGRAAVRELGVRSPLQEAQLTKEDVRALSRALGLPTWDKPSFACLASRFPYGEEITPEGLKRVDEAEEFLFSLGFKQVRVRHYGNLARIEVLREEMNRLMDPELRDNVVSRLKKIGYTYVTVDLQGFRSGSMNEVL